MSSRSAPSAALFVTVAAIFAMLVWFVVTWLKDDEVRPSTGSTQAAASTAPESVVDETPDEARRRLVVVDSVVRQEEVRLRGRVLDRDGEPLRDALVGELVASHPTATTNDGRFEILASRATEDDTVTLLVLAAEHAPRVAVRTVDARVGIQDVETIELLDGGDIRGRVTSGGVALPGASVRLRPLSGTWPAELDFDAIVGGGEMTTDGSGNYVVRDLPPGRYRITVSAAGMQSQRAPRATLVHDGAETVVEPIDLEVGFELHGRVLGPDGTPVSAATVNVDNGRIRPRFRGSVETDADGEFHVAAVPPSPLHVEVRKAGYLRFDKSDVTAATTGDPLIVRLQTGLRVSGHVVDARTGEAVEKFAATIRRVGELDPQTNGTMAQQLRRSVASLQAEASATSDPTERGQKYRVAAQLEARLERVRTGDSTHRPSVPADLGPVIVRPGGEFSFEGLDEGRYSVGIASPDHQFAAVRPVEVRQAIPSPALRVEVTPGMSVHGKVVFEHDGSPVVGATIELMHATVRSPEMSENQRSRYPWVFARSARLGVTSMQTRSGDDGEFEFRQVATGPHFLAIRHERTADHDTDVFYPGDESAALRVRVGARAQLIGRVRNIPQDGNATVIVLGGHGTMRTVDVRDDGSYRFDGLQPGDYLVRAFLASSDRYVDRLFGSLFPLHAGAIDDEKIPARDVTLAAGESRAFDLAVDLPPAGGVDGTVLIGGLPAEGGLAYLSPLQAQDAGGVSVRADCDGRGQFSLRDVPVGEYRLRIFSASRQELHRARIVIEVDTIVSLQLDLAAGGLRGRVTALESLEPDERGYVWVLPGTTEPPEDLYQYQREHRTHRVRVRNGAFASESLTPGPAVLVVEFRGRTPSTRAVVIPDGSTLELDLTAGARDD